MRLVSPKEKPIEIAKRAKREAFDQNLEILIVDTAGRLPTDVEVKKDLAFIGELKEKLKLSEADAMKQYCLLLLNTNEFVYLD